MMGQVERVERAWGYYDVLASVSAGVKVKTLVVLPGRALSHQRHFKRSELWFVAEGEAFIKSEGNLRKIRKGNIINIDVGEWHQLINDSDTPCTIVEIQYGEECIEDDIERSS